MEDTVERVMPGTDSWKYYGVEHMQRYEYFEKYYMKKSVLDAACGTGYGSDFIFKSGANEIMGIDVSKEAIDFANLNYDKGVSYKLHDCLKLQKLNKKFDLVISFETIEHLDSPEEFIKEANLVLNAGGTFICSTPNKKRLSGAGHVNPFHPNELEYEEFKKIFQKYFIIKEEYQQSESINYFRYQELKCLISKSENRNNAFLFQRFERFVRKLFGKTFVPESYFHPDLDCLYSEDMNIEPLQRTENWHKTYIIVGTVL